MTETNKEYISPYWEKFRRLWWVIAIILFIILLLLWLLGYGPGGSSCCQESGRTVNSMPPVPDTTAPAITLKGNSEIHIPVGTEYKDADAVALDQTDGNIAVVKSGRVDTTTAGKYTITYTATDAAGNTATATRTVIVENPKISDTAAPVITLNGDTQVRIVAGDTYSDAGAAATDETDGTVTVEKSGQVDTTTAGEYTITYTATDAAGNTATATRTVIVESPKISDTAAPVITLNGDTQVRIVAGDTYNDAGAAATDETDGTVTVEKSGQVDTQTAGEYTITYTAADAAGNTATATRTVIVEKTPLPPDARLYFDFNDAESPHDKNRTIPPVIDYMHKNSNAVATVTGFHDSTGNYAYNQDLARRRAKRVSMLMQKQGIAGGRIAIQVHADATGSGPPKEARRVEVTVKAHQ